MKYKNVNDIEKNIENPERNKPTALTSKSSKSKKEKNNKKNNTISLPNKAKPKTDSQKETKTGQIFYEYENENAGGIRYFFLNKYEKEIDGVYTHHKGINLNIKGEINLLETLSKLQSKQICPNNNDLGGIIIYKNFDWDIIEKGQPIFLEIKKDFICLI